MPLRAILLLLPLYAWAATPDILDLVRTTMRTEKENNDKASQYAYREYKVIVNRDSNGKQKERETETWDVIGLEGSSYSKLIMRNDKPLSPREQKRVEEQMLKEQRLRQEENAGKRPRRPHTISYSFRVQYQKLLDLYDVAMVGEEAIGGRHTSVVTATPKKDYQPKDEDEKESLNYTFKLWLEDTDAFPVRIEGELTGSGSRMERGSRLRVDYERQADVWLTQGITFQYSARLGKKDMIHGVATYTFTDYHKFQVNSTVQFSDKQ